MCRWFRKKIILENGAETVAAFIAEPISANSGVAIPPKEYWQKKSGLFAINIMFY